MPRSSSQVAVSIHALLAECDFITASIAAKQSGFNPRTPCGVRPENGRRKTGSRKFQSTHSLRSATKAVMQLIAKHGVSIHALLAECDYGIQRHARLDCGFNPRTPCGVRQSSSPLGWANDRFQSTHSLRSATSLTLGSSANSMVSIHALLAECDPRHPPYRYIGEVSIHALLAECHATDFIHYYSTEQIILCANLPKKTVIARLHFLSIYLSIFYSQCITPIADLPGNSCELEVGAQAMFHSL